MDGTSLVGFWFVLENGEHYRTGQIAEIVTHGNANVPAIYLLHFDDLLHFDEPDDGIRLPLELVSIAEMLDVCEHGVKRFNLFRHRGDLDAWITWLDTPQEGEALKVVPMVKPKPKKGS